MRYEPLLVASAALVALTACDDGAGTTEPEGQAVIEGRVESTTATATSTPDGAGTSAAQASTAEVVQFGAEGSADVLAEATVEGSGEFRVEGVPPNRTHLIVVVRDEAQATVGRVLVHGETEADVVTVVAPIDAETTVEGAASVELQANGQADVAANSGGLAAFVRMNGPEATAVASSQAGVAAVADAYAAAEATMTAGLSELGVDLDAQARSELTGPLALQYAIDRDGGVSVETAHEAFVEAILSAYVDAGASDRSLSLATAASASGAAHATAGSDGGTRLAVTRQSVSTNLLARQRVAADLSGFPGGSATIEALAQARAGLETAESMADVEANLEAIAGAAEAAVVADVLDLLSAFSLVIRNEVQSEIQAAFAQADLAARLEGQSSAEARATVLASYRADVEAAVAAVAEAMPDDVSLDTEAMVSLLIAAHGSAAVS